jgi:hypothetical protein
MTSPPEPGTPPPSAPSPGKRGCGTRGCLFGCLAPIAVVGVALVAALTVARPALDSRWEKWKAERPWVDQVIGAGQIAGELAGGSGKSDTGAAGTDSTGARAGTGKRRQGVNDKSAIPGDLPLWPRAHVEAFSVGQGHASAYQRVRAPDDSVLGYFRREMPAKGWRLDKEREGAGGMLLLYRKGERIARVEVVADSAGTEIWLRSRATGGR